jgi:hypothetical protein
VTSVVIAGAPRSGTSMLAEAFVRAGHRAGDRLIPASPENPNGFFESLDVNAANDDLLAALETVEGTVRPPRHLWWLGAFVGPTAPDDGADTAPQRNRLVPDDPFVLKDPRFSHTMPSWPMLSSALRIVMVREPSEVAASVRSMSAVVRSTPPFEASTAHCGAMWTATYASALEWSDESTIFVDVRALRAGTALASLAEITGVGLSADHVSSGLHRHGTASAECPVDPTVLDRVRERLARHEFNHEFALAPDRPPTAR